MAQAGGGLPDVIALNDPANYEIWVRWRALDKQFLPSQVAAENNALLDDILTLDAAFEAIKRSLKDG